MSDLDLNFLGSFQVMRGGRPVAFAADKVRALLAYLAVEGGPGRDQRRETLAGLLWPDFPGSDALVNLRQTLSRLRRSLGDDAAQPGGSAASPEPLVVATQTIHLEPGNYRLDVHEFMSLIKACRQHSHRQLSRCATCHRRLRRAADLYRGDFLAGFHLDDSPPFDEWLLLNREMLRREALDVFALLSSYHEAHAEYTPALSYAYKQLEFEPWREESHRQVMRLLFFDGQRNAALAHYQICRGVLLKELGMEPEPETVALYEQIKPGVRGFVAGSGSLEQAVGKAQSHNLPQQTSRFVGRERELEAITERLDSVECRLITLIGPGGAGKTHLAIQAATIQLGALDDGVWFVPLSAANSLTLLVSAIAGAIGLRLEAATSATPEAQLLAFLRDKEMLLVLDNFEQLLGEGAGLVIAALENAPGVKVLITSREHLGLQAEHIFDVAGLPLPGTAESEMVVTEALQSGAVQLFVERGRQAQWDFTLSASNAGEVAAVCRLVGGLPLGIVLAAAWVRQFSPARIARLISENLDFLTSSMRDASPEHRSLRAVFNHSWNLLAAEEKSVFRRLSIFSGGWEQEAAEKVAGATPHILSALSEKSLLRRDNSGRFDIHEVLRQYATEQLVLEPAEQQETETRHAAYFLALAEQAEGTLQGSEQASWFARLDREHNNIRAVLWWATSDQRKADESASAAGVGSQRRGTHTGPPLSHGNGKDSRPSPQEVALRLAAAVWRFWDVRGHASEGRELLAAALRSADAHASATDAQIADPAKAKALIAAASMARTQGDYAAAQKLAEQSLLLYRQLGDKAGIARVLNILGLVARRQGDYTAARALFDEALEIQRELGNKAGISALLGNLGNIAHEQRDYEAAHRYQEESLQISRVLGDREAVSAILASIGLIAHDQEQYETARVLQEESLAIRQQLGNKQGIASSLSNLAEVAFEQEDYDKAHALLLESLALREELGDKREIAFSLVILGHVYYARGEYRTARSSFLEGLRGARSLGDKYVIVWCLEGLAMMAAINGAQDVAQRSARLFGAAEALRDALQSPLPANHRRRYELQVAKVRGFLSPQSFSTAWNEGRAMLLEQIVAYALEDESLI